MVASDENEILGKFRHHKQKFPNFVRTCAVTSNFVYRRAGWLISFLRSHWRRDESVGLVIKDSVGQFYASRSNSKIVMHNYEREYRRRRSFSNDLIRVLWRHVTEPPRGRTNWAEIHTAQSHDGVLIDHLLMLCSDFGFSDYFGLQTGILSKST